MYRAWPAPRCTQKGCLPDRTNFTTITGNTIGPNIGSDPIDIKDGTTGTVITGNHIDRAGRGFTGSTASMTIFGSDVVVSGNTTSNVSGTDNCV